MVASLLLPFKKIVGIELALNVYNVCRENLNLFCNSNHNIKSKIILINCNANDYAIESGPNIYFFFNPFDGKILKEVLGNILNSPNKHSQDLYIYVNPRHEFIFELFELKKITTIDNVNFNKIVHIYQTH